jgi:mono/diheme cytochrome c family protein
LLAPVLLLTACSWFTDFKEQPKIDPWDSSSDTIPPRANPQGSVPITGSSAPEMIYSHEESPTIYMQMSTIANPIAPDSASVNNGRKLFQINCAVCHGAGAQGRVLAKYGIAAPALAGADTSVHANGYTDGFIFAIIRNGKGGMPPYVRIEETERWDIINYLRSLQGKSAIAADTSHGRPGETGAYLPHSSRTAPTHPAPYYRGAEAVPSGPVPAVVGPTPPVPAAGRGGASPTTKKGG